MTRDVFVIGVGQTRVTEHWNRGLADLAGEALRSAAADAAIQQPDVLIVGNMMAGQLSHQSNLGTYIATAVGWTGVEATTVEAACASGGVAFQAGIRAITSGEADLAAVCGVEKMTDVPGEWISSALATAADADYEVAHGVTFVALNALAMQRYIAEHGLLHEDFAPFPIQAHANAVGNPNAMFRYPLSLDAYRQAPVIAPPIALFDSSPVCDGAAAVVLASREALARLTDARPIRVLASATVTDSVSLHDRAGGDILAMEAVAASTARALRQAGLKRQDIDFAELHDAFSSMVVLSLEAGGFAPPGRAPWMAAEGEFSIEGRLPISTMGGLKARGHPVGATGVYQIIDVVTQLRGEAGPNQVRNAEIGMAQNLGGTGATVTTHILAGS